jgi:hypothetical protein
LDKGGGSFGKRGFAPLGLPQVESLTEGRIIFHYDLILLLAYHKMAAMSKNTHNPVPPLRNISTNIASWMSGGRRIIRLINIEGDKKAIKAPSANMLNIIASIVIKVRSG